MIKLLIDENVASKVKEGLISRGYLDTKHINDIKKGITDDEVFNIAKAEGRVLISGDYDFKDNNFKYKCGIIWITPKEKMYVEDSISKICWIMEHIDNYSIKMDEAFIEIRRNSYSISYKRGMEKQIKEKEIDYSKIKEFSIKNS
jgi:predicted nuclease of predicted toxin-antitoxin system